MAGKNSARFTGVEEVEYPFLTEVATPQVEHKIDLVFVHGLNPFGRDDHPTQTWTHENGAFWPLDFLPEDLPYARIFVYGYNSNVSKGSSMSLAGVRHHSEQLLNHLNMERGMEQGQSLSKIIFIGHSLGGLVIKQALVIAHQNPMYTAIRNATFGLVFFGCPHHGAKGIELGKIATSVAKFVSQGRASNDLLESLEHNSLFTRQVSNEFRHQLEDYQVVSFIEGLPMQLGGYGPTSISRIVVEEESAVLGLSGSRETQLMLNADHSAMCKIGMKGNMYKSIKGNIKLLADKAVASTQGYVPPPTHNPSPTSFPAPPPLPSRPQVNASSSYAAPPPNGTMAKVTGSLFYPTGTGTKSLSLAKLKNTGHWDQAQPLEYEIFQDKLKTLGPGHLNTLNTGYDLACTYVELGLLKEASEWVRWVTNTNKSNLDQEHNILSMKVKSLHGEILQSQGDNHGCENVCATALASQQDSLGDDSLDTLATQARLASACNSLGRREVAVRRLRTRVQILERVVGGTHILSIVATLDLVDVTIDHHLGDQFGTARLNGDVETAARIIPAICANLKNSLGPRNQVSIRALAICGKIKILQGESTEASDLLRRGLSYAEEILGVNHPLTIDIVSAIAIMYMKQQGQSYKSNGPPEMRPWFQRTLDWLEKRKGDKYQATRTVLQILALSYMSAKEYDKAEQYYERLSISYGGDNSKEAQQVNSMLQLCRMNRW